MLLLNLLDLSMILFTGVEVSIIVIFDLLLSIPNSGLKLGHHVRRNQSKELLDLQIFLLILLDEHFHEVVVRGEGTLHLRREVLVEDGLGLLQNDLLDGLQAAVNQDLGDLDARELSGTIGAASALEPSHL